MIYDELYDNFIEAVPKAREFCDPLVKADGVDKSDGMHWFFGVYVVPFIIYADENEDIDTMKQVASFLEKAETSGQEDISGVIEQSVMEAILDRNRDIVEKYGSLWGDATKAAFDAVGEYIRPS